MPAAPQVKDLATAWRVSVAPPAATQLGPVQTGAAVLVNGGATRSRAMYVTQSFPSPRQLEALIRCLELKDMIVVIEDHRARCPIWRDRIP